MLLAIKLGGSAITEKEKEFSVREEVLERVADELSTLEEDFFLVHGGGSFGHLVASKYNISSGYSHEDQLMGFSETHRAMEELNSRVIDYLLDAGQPAVQIQTSACTVVGDGEIISMELRNIRKLLDLGIVPVLYGDAVPDQKQGMSILSGDQLIAFLARELGASKVILGTDIEGIFTSDPKSEGDSQLIPKITPESWKSMASTMDLPSGRDVTGGMRNKIEVLVNLAKEGLESQIINLTKPGNLKRAIRSDKRVGTKITME